MFGNTIDSVEVCKSAKKVSGLKSAVIKFRQDSKKHILNKFEKELEEKKRALLNQKFQKDPGGDYLTKSSMNMLNRKTKAISFLEGIVNYLSYDTVPKNYVSTHAIKLRDKMFANLHLNSDNVYEVGADKYDEVFASEVNNSVPEADISVPVVNASVPEADITVPVVNASVPEVDISVPDNNAFNPTDMVEENDSTNTSNLEDAVSEVNTQSITDSIKREVEKINNTSSSTVVPPEEVAKVVKGSTPITHSEIENSIRSKVYSISSNEAESPSYQDLEIPEESSIDFKANQNESRAVKIDHFDENGLSVEKPWIKEEEKIQNYDIPGDVQIPVINEPVSDSIPLPTDVSDDSIHPVEDHSVEQKVEEHPVHEEWTPLTDEQIEAFKKDLEEHPIVSGDQLNDEMKIDMADPVIELQKEEPVRDFVVVTPDREVSSTVVKEEIPDNSRNETIENYIGHETSKEELEKLKERIAELAVRQKASKEAMYEAEKLDQDVAKRAEEALRAKEESDLAREESMQRLRDYSEALEEDCNYNENRRRIAIENAECNERFIEVQREKIRVNDEMINTMNSLIGEEAINVRRR